MSSTNEMARHLRWVCRFHALTLDQLRRGAPDLPWDALSGNRELPWSKSLVLDNLRRWSHVALLRNPSVPWDAELIQAYPKADFFYLSQNTTLKQSAVFRREFADRIVWDFADQAEPEMPRCLQDVVRDLDGFGLDPATLLSEVTPEQLHLVRSEIAWPVFRTEAFAWTAAHAEAVRSEMRWAFDHPAGAQLYRDLVLPSVGEVDAFLEQVFAEPLLRLEGLWADDYGLLPGIDLPHGELVEVWETPPTGIQASVSPYKEGPTRFLDIIRAQIFVPGLVLHQRLKPLLDQFQLPDHMWIPLQIEARGWKNVHALFVVRKASGKVPACDVVGNDDGGVFVSRRLHQALVESGVTGVQTASAVGWGWRFDGSLTPVDWSPLAPHEEQDPRTETYRFFEAKAARLRDAPGRLPATHVHASGAIGGAEKRLQRAFPQGLRRWLAAGRGHVGDGFRRLASSRVYLLDDPVLFKNHPEAFGAVVVGEDGGGDALIVVLKKRSDTSVGTTLFALRHESGRLERWGTAR